MDKPTRTIYDTLISFRDVWSRTNYPDFMGYFFSEIPTDSPQYDDEYHLNRWIQFRDTPLKFFCDVDMENRRILCDLIENKVIE
jgi:hypothetical protein